MGKRLSVVNRVAGPGATARRVRGEGRGGGARFAIGGRWLHTGEPNLGRSPRRGMLGGQRRRANRPGTASDIQSAGLEQLGRD